MTQNFFGTQTNKIWLKPETSDPEYPTIADEIVFLHNPDEMESAIRRNQIVSTNLRLSEDATICRYTDWCIPPIFSISEVHKVARIPYLWTDDKYGYPTQFGPWNQVS